MAEQANPSTSGETASDSPSAILQASQIGFAVFAADHRFLQANKAFHKLLGLRPDQAPPPGLAQFPGVDEALLQRVDQGEAVQCDLFIDFEELTRRGWQTERRQQELFAELCLERSQEEPPRYVMSLRDNSRRKIAERNLEMLGLATEQASNAILVTNAEGRIQFVNPAFVRTSGYSAEEAVGKLPSILKSGLMPEETYRRMWSILKEGKVWRGELLNRRRNGELYWISSSISPIKDPRGRICQYLSVHEDITERKLNKGRRELQHSVARILGQEKSFRNAAAPLAEALAEALNCGWVEIWELDRASGDLVCRAFKAQGNDAPTDAPEPGTRIPKDATQDPHWMPLRALSELRFSGQGRQGSVGFAIRSAKRNEGVIILGDIVRDDGSLTLLLQGICSQMGDYIQHAREHEELSMLGLIAQSIPFLLLIADPEGRILWCNTRLERRLGLGLDELRRRSVPDLAKTTSAVPRFRDIELPTRDNKGFRLAMNLVAIQSGEGSRSHIVGTCPEHLVGADTPQSQRRAGGGSDILIIDDAPANTTLLKAFFLRQELEVRTANSGAEGLAEAARLLPGVVLLDLSMPEMDGFEVCARFKQDPGLRDVPIIFMSGLDDASDKVKAFRMGGVDYITKPFELEEVRARVKLQLRLHDYQGELEQQKQNLELTVAQRTAELEEAVRKLASVDSFRNEFLMLLAREVRTPAHGLLATCELLLDASPPSAERDQYQQLFDASRSRLLQLIEDTQQLSRLGSPDAIHRERCSLSKVWTELTETMPDCANYVPGDAKVAMSAENLLQVLRTGFALAASFSGTGGRPRFQLETAGSQLQLRFPLDEMPLRPERYHEFFELASDARNYTPAEPLSIAPVVTHRLLAIAGGSIAFEDTTDGKTELLIKLPIAPETPKG
jgi:PAS domain S-box-containing protein